MYDVDTADFVEIYRTRRREQAEMVENILQYAGIPVASRRELPEGVQPEDFESEHVQGEHYVVFVPEVAAEEALALVPNRAAEEEFGEEEELSEEELEALRARKHAARALILTLLLPLMIGLLAVVLILVGTW